MQSCLGGGRAYKLPGPGGSRRKPKLLAFVTSTKDEKAVSVGFKLPVPRAAEVVERYAWIEPHSFGALGKSGWVAARLSSPRHLKMLSRLLAEARKLHPVQDVEERPTGTPAAATFSSVTAKHIDRVMREVRAEGWEPTGGDFE